MATAQREATISKQQSLTLIKNMIRISVSSICYLRSVFPDDCFVTKLYGKTEIRQLKSAEQDAEGNVQVWNTDAFLLTQWLERGVFSALSAEYLSSMIFSVFTKHPVHGHDVLLENYEFKISYREDNSATVNGVPLVSKEDLKNQSTKFVRMLIEFTNTLDDVSVNKVATIYCLISPKLPQNRWITISLRYTDQAPAEYEPEFFEAGDEKLLTFSTAPIRVQIGSLKTPHQDMTLKFVGLESLLLEDICRLGAVDTNRVTEPKAPDSLFRGNHFPTLSEAQVPGIEKSTTGLTVKQPTKLNLEDDISVASIGSLSIRDEKTGNGGTITGDIKGESRSLSIVRDYVMSAGKFTIRKCVNDLGLAEAIISKALEHMVTDGLIVVKGRSYTAVEGAFRTQGPISAITQTLQHEESNHKTPKKGGKDMRGSSTDIETTCADDEIGPIKVSTGSNISNRSSFSSAVYHDDSCSSKKRSHATDDDVLLNLSQTSDRSESGRNARRKYSTIKDPIYFNH